MKKLITGAVTTLALLFGFASCSGDLHDNDIQPLTIVGLVRDGLANSDLNFCVPMTLDKADGTEQSLKIKLAADTELIGADGKKHKLINGWGKLAPEFKIVPSVNVKADGTPDWAVDYGWETDAGKLYLTPGDDEYKTLLKRGDPGTTSLGPSNVAISAPVENEEYVIKVRYDAAKQSVSIKVEGVASDSSAIKFAIDGTSENFPATKKLADGTTKDLSYTMTKSGTTYTYQFVSVKDEIISFHLKNDMAGTLGGTLSTTAANLIVNAETVTNMSLTVKKNVEYKITVDTAAGISKPTIKYEVIDMLKDATVNANWKYADAASAYAEKITKDSYQFFAEREEIDFTVLRHDGGVWGKDNAGTFNVDSDAVELAYSTAKDAAKATTVKVKGLAVGACYKVVLEKNNADFTLKAKVITVPIDSYFEAGDLVGDMGNDGIKLTKESDGSYSWSFTYDNSWNGWGGGSGKLIFAMRYVAGDWDGGQTGFSGFYKGTLPAGYDYVENSGNPAITGMENGKKYKLSFVPDYGWSKVNLEIME